MKRPRATKPSSPVGTVVALLLAFAFVGLISSCLITIAIWPGQVKLLAPVFCSDAQPDPFVVSDTYNPRPGETVTDFTLYCMGPRGDATDHGFLRPFLLISVVNGLVIVGTFVVVSVLAGIVGAMRRSSPDEMASPPNSDTARDDQARSAAPPGSTSGPFVE